MSHQGLWTVAGIAVLASALGVAAGCATSPVPVDPAIRNVMAVTIKDAVRLRGVDAPYVFKLPEAYALPDAYNSISAELGPNATPMLGHQPANMPIIEIVNVDVRGWTAVVDVIEPTDPKKPDAPAQLVTAHLRWEVGGGWYVKHRQEWQMPVEQALEASRKQSFDSPPGESQQAPEPAPAPPPVSTPPPSPPPAPAPQGADN